MIQKAGQVIFMICCISLFSGILMQISPQKKFKKIYQFSVGTIFLAMVITAITGQTMNLGTNPLEMLDIPKNQQSISSDELILESVKENAEIKIKSLLESRGIQCDKVSVTVHKNENNVILISEVVVTTDHTLEEVSREIEIIAGEKIPCSVINGEKSNGQENNT